MLHDRSLARHGGVEGIRDLGLLESALTRPKNRYVYDGVTDIPELAATYAVALSANRPFTDGNKRVAFVCLTLFLRLNGCKLTADPVEATQIMVALASGQIDIPRLAAWTRSNSRPV